MKNWLALIGTLMVIVVTVFVAAGKASHRHMESLSCGESLLSIGYATRLWAADHDGRLPAEFQSASNQLRSPQILICPGDHARQPAVSWASWTTNQCSYEIVSPGLTVTNRKNIFIRCKIHEFVVYADGSVFDGLRQITR